MYNHNKISGFTLIELLSVIAIIGILAALALPAYQDYLIRTKLAEVIRFSSAAKIYLWEEYFTKAAMPENTSIAADTVEKMMLASDIIGAVTYAKADTNNASLDVTLTNTGLADGKTILFVFITDGKLITLDCRGGTLPEKYRPSACRNT